MNFTLQPEHMLNSCLNFNEPQSLYAYKRYAYKDSVVKVLNNNCLLFTLGAETSSEKISKFLHFGSINLS